MHARLASVVIDCLPWRAFVERYDRPGMLFYLDPPYWGSEDDYGAAFDRSEFEALAAVLGSLKGHFILSLNDVPPVRRLFGRFSVQPVGVLYRISSGVTAAKEVIITGP